MGVCRAPPRVPTRDTPTVVLASGGTPVGNTWPPHPDPSGDKPPRYIFPSPPVYSAPVSLSGKCFLTKCREKTNSQD